MSSRNLSLFIRILWCIRILWVLRVSWRFWISKTFWIIRIIKKSYISILFFINFYFSSIWPSNKECSVLLTFWSILIKWFFISIHSTLPSRSTFNIFNIILITYSIQRSISSLPTSIPEHISKCSVSISISFFIIGLRSFSSFTYTSSLSIISIYEISIRNSSKIFLRFSPSS